MASYLQWVKTKRTHRLYEVIGLDSAIKIDALDEIIRRVAPSTRQYLVAGDMSDEELWSEVMTTSWYSGSRLVIISNSERIHWWNPLREWLDNQSIYADTTLVLASSSDPRDKTKKNDEFWLSSLSDPFQWIDDHSSAITLVCSTPSIEIPAARNETLSPLARWLSRRLSVSQLQAEYLWRRAGEQTTPARDVVTQIALLRVSEAEFSENKFREIVDALLSPRGAENFVDLLLFNRRSLAIAALENREFSRREWSSIIGLLSQRLEWLSALQSTLSTTETLEQVENRLGIHRKFILYYAHRWNPAHNIAKWYTPKKIASCRQLLAFCDAALAATRGVPVGMGEVLIAGW
jgi:hypothetical protein